VLRDYPDTKYAEEMEFLTIKAQYLYAKSSIEYKQEERFTAAINDYQQFKDKYPNSRYLAEAAQLSNNSRSGISDAKRVLAEAVTNQKLARKLSKKDTAKTEPPSEKGNGNQKMP
jgi:outer membrane protein assembly factor BamD